MTRAKKNDLRAQLGAVCMAQHRTIDLRSYLSQALTRKGEYVQLIAHIDSLSRLSNVRLFVINAMNDKGRSANASASTRDTCNPTFICSCVSDVAVWHAATIYETNSLELIERLRGKRAVKMRLRH